MKIKINYTNKKIQDVKKGDYVVSFDIDNDVFRHNEVLETHLPIVEKERQIKIISGDHSVTTSTSHPMCNFNNKWDYKPSGEIIEGDILKSETLDKVSVNKILIGNDIEEDIDQQFYDITVNNDNNYLAGDTDKLLVIHNSSTTHIPFWHKEIEDVLVLKNNKGTDDNRVRKMDYSIQFCRLFYKRFLNNENVTLFSPHDVPDLYQAFGFNDKFDELYVKYEKSNKISKKTIKARDLFNQFCQERIGTGRIYLMNIDNANDHSSFTDKIYMSNLCLKGDTNIDVKIEIDNILIDYLHKFNLNYDNGIYSGQMNIKDITELFELMYIESNKFENVVIMRSLGKIEVLSYDIINDKYEYMPIMKAMKTGDNKDVLKITDIDTNSSIVCTEDHLIYTNNRGYVKACELNENDILKIFTNKMVENINYNLI